MFTLVYPVYSLDWLWLGIAVLADISDYAAGGAAQGCVVLPGAVRETKD